MTSNRKRIVFGTLAALVAVVALDSVYLLGYRHGMQKERRAGAARREVSYNIVVLTGRGARTVLNTPDPRTYRRFEHSSP